MHPSPCWDDIWDSNITGILQKTLWFIWRCWSKTVVDPLLRKIWDPPLSLLIYSYEENPLGVPNFSLVFSVRKQTRMYYWVAKTCLISCRFLPDLEISPKSHQLRYQNLNNPKITQISLRSLQNVCMGDCIKTLTQHLLRCSPSLWQPLLSPVQHHFWNNNTEWRTIYWFTKDLASTDFQIKSSTSVTHLIGFSVVSVSKKKQYKLMVLTITACTFEPILREKKFNKNIKFF